MNIELEKVVITPRGAKKRTAAQLEKLYQDAGLRTLSDGYSDVYCYIELEDGDCVNTNHTTTIDCQFDEPSFIRKSTPNDLGSKPIRAHVLYFHKIYTTQMRGKSFIHGPYRWEWKRNVVNL